MILLAAILAGLLVGLVWARWHGKSYQTPNLKHLWLVFAAFLPQFLIIYVSKDNFPDWLASVCLLTSQVLLLGFAWLNRHSLGMTILSFGVLLNLVVMASNGGFMPISPQTASRLVSQNIVADIEPGSRIGPKDVLLRTEDTRFEWLADRFLTPNWFLSRVAFSLGDVFLALGVFWLLAKPESTTPFIRGK